MKLKFGEKADVWDMFVNRSPQGSVFLTSNFINGLSIPYELVTLYEGNNIVAGTAIFFDQEGTPINEPNMFMLYQGLILADNSTLGIHSRLTHEFKVTTYFLNELVRHYDQLHFSNSWKLNDIRPFQWVNYHNPEKGQFTIQPRYTGIIQLDKYHSFEGYLKNIRKLRLREWKKASKNIKINETDEIELMLDLHDRTYLRQDIRLSAKLRDYRHSLVKNALHFGIGRMIKATNNSEVDSIKFFLYDKSCAYYLFGANNPAGRGSGASTFLMLHFIQDAMVRGLKYVDLCGVNSPNRGDYKISFNAELRPYFIVNYVKRQPLQN